MKQNKQGNTTNHPEYKKRNEDIIMLHNEGFNDEAISRGITLLLDEEGNSHKPISRQRVNEIVQRWETKMGLTKEDRIRRSIDSIKERIK